MRKTRAQSNTMVLCVACVSEREGGARRTLPAGQGRRPASLPPSASAAPRPERVPARAMPHSFLIVDPELHGSGFGNQVGMLLQHVALAALSGRTLVLPAIHQPLEHRHDRDAAETLDAGTVFNLSALAPLARVLEQRQLGRVAGGDFGVDAQLTFGVLSGAARGLPLRMEPAPLPSLLAAVRLLRSSSGCAEEEERAGRARSSAPCHRISYCHTPSCRTRTRRACRSLPRAAAAQQLPLCPPAGAAGVQPRRRGRRRQRRRRRRRRQQRRGRATDGPAGRRR